MIRPVLLAALLVCSIGVASVAIQPAAGDVISTTPTPDEPSDSDQGSTDRRTHDGMEGGDDDSDGGDDDSDGDGHRGWYDGWESADDRTRDRDRNRSAGGDAERNGTDDGADERSEDGATDGNSTTAGDDGDDRDDRDDWDDRDDRDDRTDESDGSAGGDRGDRPATTALPLNATVGVLEVTRGTLREVTDGTPLTADRGGGADGSLTRGGGSAEAPAVTGDGEAPVERFVPPAVGGLLPATAYGELRGVDDTVGGLLDRSVGLLTFGERDGRAGGTRPAGEAMPGETSADGVAQTGTTVDEAGRVSSPPSGGDIAAPLKAGETGDRGDGDGTPEGADPAGGPVGAGVALFATVGCLGGSRVAVTQANLLTSTGVEGTLTSLRGVLADHLGRLPDHVVPPVFGYSRHDASDPLENETRAAIYDLVCESPGIYHARLAEETDVAVETVRYHCRILAEEGLVEPRKHRGKRRLYPVSMDDGDPELAAAIADSAAADVLAAIRRLEPATLSAVAEHVDCAPSTVAYHLDRLEEDGLVSRERDGGAVEVRLRRSARSALEGTVADD